MTKPKVDQQLQAWIDARQRHRLSHAHVQMARELGLNPAKLGKLDNHRQEPWKAPLPEFIEHLYERSFGRRRPETVLTLEQVARERTKKARARREAKKRRKLQDAHSETTSGGAAPQPNADSQSS